MPNLMDLIRRSAGFFRSRTQGQMREELFLITARSETSFQRQASGLFSTTVFGLMAPILTVWLILGLVTLICSIAYATLTYILQALQADIRWLLGLTG